MFKNISTFSRNFDVVHGNADSDVFLGGWIPSEFKEVDALCVRNATQSHLLIAALCSFLHLQTYYRTQVFERFQMI